MFQPGDKVKCIDPSGTGFTEGGFIMNAIYTVRSTSEPDSTGKYLVYVDGMGGTCMFNYRFIPVGPRRRVKTGFGKFLEKHSL